MKKLTEQSKYNIIGINTFTQAFTLLPVIVKFKAFVMAKTHKQNACQLKPNSKCCHLKKNCSYARVISDTLSINKSDCAIALSSCVYFTLFFVHLSKF